MMRCFSVCWCSQRGHLYWTSSYWKLYFLAMYGMNSCRGRGKNSLSQFFGSLFLCRKKKSLLQETDFSLRYRTSENEIPQRKLVSFLIHTKQWAPSWTINTNCKASYPETTQSFSIFLHTVPYEPFYSDPQMSLKECITRIIKIHRWDNYLGVYKEV